MRLFVGPRLRVIAFSTLATHANLTALVFQRTQPNFQCDRLQQTADVEFDAVARAVECLCQLLDVHVAVAAYACIVKQRPKARPFVREAATESFTRGAF